MHADQDHPDFEHSAFAPLMAAIPELRHPPKPLDITVQTGYPWTHRSGHVVGRADRVLNPCLRPRTATAQAVSTFLAAPTLTDSVWSE